MTKNNFDALVRTDDSAAFTKAVESINKRGQTLQLDIQKYLYAVAARWKETGDVRPAVIRVNMLIDKKQLFKGVRRNAIIAWVELNLGFEYITEGEHKDTFHANKAKADRFNLIELAKAENHWYNATPEPDPQPLSLNVLLKALVAKAEKRASKHVAGDEIDPDQLSAIKALVKSDDALEGAVETA